MILVDSSVWIDYFTGRNSRSADRLHEWVGRVEIGIGDLIAVEVLQGFRSNSDFDQARRLLARFPLVTLLPPDRVGACARNYRSLRHHGVTVRSTIDVIIATCCIDEGHALLYSDRDFDPFIEHMGLRNALDDGAGPNAFNAP